MNEKSSTAATPIWFWIVSVIALLWNLMGALAFAGTMMMSGNMEALREAGMNEEQADLMANIPTWVNVAFGVAVVCGTLGCVALLMRSKFAILLLMFSLVGVIAQNVHVYFLSNSVEVMGIGLSPLVILISVALVPFAMFCGKKGWLR